jgi:small subunit ribosomal protein S3Ae
MAIGKNKKLGKGRKGGKKKYIDPMSKKEWYDYKAPYPFEATAFGKTCINRTQGTKISSERIKGRVVEASLADLKPNMDHMSWRKIKLMIEDIEGKNARTSFYGMDMTRDKLCQFIKKRQTLIEAFVDVKTKDGYVMRVFLVAFTRKQKAQLSKTCYAQRQQIKKIRAKMVEYISGLASSTHLGNFVKGIITDNMETIVKNCQFIFPIHNVVVRKIKMLKKPKMDVTKLNEMFAEAKKEAMKMGNDNEEDDEAKNLLK